MADFTLTITATTVAKLDDLFKNYALYNGWTEKVNDGSGNVIDNPITAKEYARKLIKSSVRGQAKEYKARMASDVAREVVLAEDDGVS